MIELPATVKTLLDSADGDAYKVEHGRQQAMLWFGDRDGRWHKIGGWNTRHGHWYVSKLMARGRDDLMERHGFRWRVKSSGGHGWWQIDGADHAPAFQAAVEALTGVAFPLPTNS